MYDIISTATQGFTNGDMCKANGLSIHLEKKQINNCTASKITCYKFFRK